MSSPPRTEWGGVWVGSVFLAAATSLPEIITDIWAVRIGAPDLAAGDLFGSSMANMVILAVVTVIPAGTELFQKATLDHALYASLDGAGARRPRVPRARTAVASGAE